MRDLATYEHNFAENTDNFRGQKFNENLNVLISVIDDAAVKLKQNVAFNEDGEPYFTSRRLSMDEGRPVELSFDSSEKASENARHFLKDREID
jgi:hypothetical protein